MDKTEMIVRITAGLLASQNYGCQNYDVAIQDATVIVDKILEKMWEDLIPFPERVV